MCAGLVLIFFGALWCPDSGAAQPIGATFCQTAKPITWASNDTRMTKEQIDEHNAVGKARCGWGQKK